MSEPLPAQEPPQPDPIPPVDSGAAPDAPEPGGSSTVTANVDEIEGDAYFAQVIHQYQARIERQERPRLARDRHFEDCGRSQLEREQRELFSWSLAEHETLVTTLESRRLLILCGEPELGKGSIARLLAAGLCARHDLAGMLYCRQSPTRDLEIPFHEICGGKREYREHVVILKDVLARDNVDAQRFLQDLDNLRLASQTNELVRNKTFLILTSDSERLDKLEAKLRGYGILHILSPPPVDVLVDALRLLTAPLSNKEPTRQALHALLRSEEVRIASELKTLPRLARFVRESLEGVLGSPGLLEQALRRASDLESWLLRDLPEDFEAWCYALALVLCHSAPLSEHVSWWHFNHFRQLLTRHLRRELRRSSEQHNAADLCREETLARLARAEVQHPGYPQVATVAFSSDSYPAQLWKVLLGPGRHLLTILLPLLHDLTAAPEFYLRTLAARAIGRIGELDPYGVTFPRLHNPGAGEQRRQAELLGCMLQGALGSQDGGYRQACLRQLRRKLHARGAEPILALFSLGEIGAMDLALAIAEMRRGASHWLLPRFEERKELGEWLQRYERRARSGEGVAALGLRMAQDGALEILLSDLLSSNAFEVLKALQYSLVGLCFEHDPMTVLSALQDWVEEEAPRAGQLLAILFLRRNGIIDVLERIRLPAPSGETDSSMEDGECGAILFSMALLGKENTVPVVQGFLETLHNRISTLPGPFRTGLRRRWLALLKSWAQQACEAEACRPAVGLLLAKLVRSGSAGVGEDVLSLLQGDGDFLEPDSDLEALAIAAITGG